MRTAVSSLPRQRLTSLGRSRKSCPLCRLTDQIIIFSVNAPFCLLKTEHSLLKHSKWQAHRVTQRLRLVVSHYFYALDLEAAIQHTSRGCHQCAALAKSPSFAVEQSSCDPPEAVGSSFAADVLKRARQLILVVRECVTSFTAALLIADERKETLRDVRAMMCPEFINGSNNSREAHSQHKSGLLLPHGLMVSWKVNELPW
ncbi:hypothetical protein DPX16_6377 [Anabarilius grahami]|uniref:Uncharacterized protein n=1 Tax=Anabarilius grahami TaxID=495550 RepID=A0A3N0YUW1_ANAGA|nr:hypothetical protein DPX16_6377 [Anabarilius grahami]